MFLVCGEALYDLILEGIGREVGVRAVPGGSPFNVAVGLARLGCRVALSTEIGEDALGRRLGGFLAEEGVDVRFVRRSSSATALAVVDVDASGGATYAFHGLENRAFHPEGPVPADHGVLHLGSLALVSPRSAEPLLRLAGRHAFSGGLVSLDPNVRLAMEPDAARWRSRVDGFREQAHLIKVSQEDLVALYGEETDGDAVARGWLEHRCGLVIVTRGAEGATLHARGHDPVEVAAAPEVLVDTVGAGDSFQAAVLAWLGRNGHATPEGLARLSAADLRAMGEFASLCAARTCSRRGPDLPRWDEVGAGSRP